MGPEHTPPRLTVNVGITGHRRISPQSEPALRQKVADFLQLIQQQVHDMLEGENADPLAKTLYAPQPPRFVLLSPLAAGADSLVAQEALKLGYELHSPLPLARDEYAKDFDTPETLATFNELLSQTTRVFEIQAANPERSHAYADASRIVLNHSDIMLALWDGRDTSYVAGTAATLEQASKQHIPAVHMHPDGALPTCFLIDGLRHTNWEEMMREHFESLLLPMEAKSEKRSRSSEQPPSKLVELLCAGWRKFLQLFGEQRFIRSCARQTRDSEPSRYVKAFFPFCRAVRFLFLKLLWLLTQLSKGCNVILNLFLKLFVWIRPVPMVEVETLAPKEVFSRHNQESRAEWQHHFELFDSLSGLYSAHYRSGLLLRYWAPVVATLCLAFALSKDLCQFCIEKFNEHVCSLDTITIDLKSLAADFFRFQAFFLCVPIILLFLDCWRMWHRKFFSYRVVGEQLRQTKFLGSIGFFMVRSKESTYTNSPQRWTAWYYRALMRDSGLPRATVDERYLVDWMAWTRDQFVVEQLNYHGIRWRRDGVLCRKLGWAGSIMFLVGVGVAVARGVLATSEGVSDIFLSFVSFLTMLVPAVAVFFAGYCAYAGYAKNQQMSYAGSRYLTAILLEMDVFLHKAGYKVPLTPETLAHIQSEPLHFSRAYGIAEQLNDFCKSELLSWEDLISTKGIKPH